MKLSTMTLALGIALAPFAAHATLQHRYPLNHEHAAISPKATALAPAVKPNDDDPDGLTRNRDECNRGCIDNN
jgi:hypothetical protein